MTRPFCAMLATVVLTSAMPAQSAWLDDGETKTLRRALRAAKEVALVYRVTGDTLEGAVVTPNAVHRHRIEGDVATWRTRIARFNTLLQTPGFGWDASTAASRLYRALVQPLLERAGVIDPTHLIVVPAGPLRELEFATLAAREETRTWLGFLTAITYAPDVPTIARLLERSVTSPDRLPTILAVAPETGRRSAEGLAASGSARSSTLIGALADADAFRSAVERNAPSLIYSDHPLTTDGIRFGAIAVRPDESTPRLRPDLLIAPRTGETAAANPITTADTWLRHGARTVLATRWPLRAQARHAFVERFVHYLRDGEEPAGALVQARREFSRSPGVGGPSTWAAFALIGDGRGTWTLAQPLRWFSIWWGVGLVTSLLLGYRVVRLLAQRAQANQESHSGKCQ